MQRPTNLAELRRSGWKSRSVKQELRENLTRALASGEELFPGIVGYDDTVIPEIVIALLAGHDMLFLGEKGQAKSRLMRSLVRFLDPELPYLDVPGTPFHEDPEHPLSSAARKFVAQHEPDEIPIAWWPREARYAERLAPGTKFADVIGEIDPAKLVEGVSMSTEEALHFGLIPRMHRGLFAMNELPELDELVQVGLFNILEERDVQIRGYPVKFDLDMVVLFSANPSTYNRSGKGDSAAQGSYRHVGADSLSAGTRLGDRDPAASRARSRGPLPGTSSLFHARDHRADFGRGA
ncbi:MAG: hypothetical protein R3B96_23640 [Pirellulaceae bacterium]